MFVCVCLSSTCDNYGDSGLTLCPRALQVCKRSTVLPDDNYFIAINLLFDYICLLPLSPVWLLLPHLCGLKACFDSRLHHMCFIHYHMLLTCVVSSYISHLLPLCITPSAWLWFCCISAPVTTVRWHPLINLVSGNFLCRPYSQSTKYGKITNITWLKS